MLQRHLQNVLWKFSYLVFMFIVLYHILKPNLGCIFKAGVSLCQELYIFLVINLWIVMNWTFTESRISSSIYINWYTQINEGTLMWSFKLLDETTTFPKNHTLLSWKKNWAYSSSSSSSSSLLFNIWCGWENLTGASQHQMSVIVLAGFS